MDETEQVLRCQQGDRDAFRPLVERYGDTLFGTAFLMTRDRTMAEDMVQSAFLLAWKSIPQFKPGSNLKAWLVRILVNRVMSDRRRKRLPQTTLDAAYAVSGDAEGGLEALIHAERQEEIRIALYTLDEQTRQAIVLRYFAELSVREISSTLNWAEGTVKSRIHRGLSKLKTHFDTAAPSLAMAFEE